MMSEQQKNEIVELAKACERFMIHANHNPNAMATKYSSRMANEASAEAFRIAQESQE